MIHGQVMQPPVEAGHVDVKQASSVGKIVSMANKLAARYLDKIICNKEIGLVESSSIVPVLFSSAKHLIVNAGKRNIRIPGACAKNDCSEASPISIILLFPEKTQTKNPEVIKKTAMAA